MNQLDRLEALAAKARVVRITVEGMGVTSIEPNCYRDLIRVARAAKALTSFKKMPSIQNEYPDLVNELRTALASLFSEVE